MNGETQINYKKASNYKAFTKNDKSKFFFLKKAGYYF